MLKTLVSACAFAVLAVMISETASAQAIDRRTRFTFTQPVTLPGVTLPAGTYVFRIVDVDTTRRVVQVLDASETRAYATLLSIPVQRHGVAAEPGVSFMETAETMPPAIKSWWYPGSSIGYEFLYPREQEMRLARAAAAPAPMTSAGAASSSVAVGTMAGGPPAGDEPITDLE